MAIIGEEFQKRYKTLPEDIQNALTAVASVDTIFAIGKKHGLMVDQIGKMADEIWKVMLGLSDPKDFIRNLAGALGIESEKASAIASEVNAQMFQQVRESLRKIYDSSTTPAVSITPPSPPYPKGGGKEENEISPLKLRGVGGVMEKEQQPKMPSMIYPQDTRLPDRQAGGQGFEEEFKKEPASEMFDTKGRTKGEPEQLAPLVPTITPLNPPYSKGEAQSVPPLKVSPAGRGEEGPKMRGTFGQEELLYPEKMKEVSREPAASQGSYKGRPANYAGRDPYREAVE